MRKYYSLNGKRNSLNGASNDFGDIGGFIVSALKIAGRPLTASELYDRCPPPNTRNHKYSKR